MMAEWLARIGTATNVREVLKVCGEEFESRGVIMRSYHFADSFGSQVGASVVVTASGYPETWTALYEDPEFRANDPIPDFIMRAGRTMTWLQALAEQKLTLGQQRFVEAMEQHGLQHGIGSPIFGPNGREAYVGFSFGRPIVPEDEQLIRLLVAIAQSGHRRITTLTSRRIKPPVLSERESEVLAWMLRGKSVREIAGIIGCAPGTAETYAKRLYAKLEVNDRTSAMVVSMRYGLVRL
jgi:DNA-binding CsgD family transcriptional regulator